MNSPFLRQLFVASSPQLAAISVGGSVGLPNVLLEQLKANDSSIHLDLDVATWIGSTHGLAGLPSIAMPAIMQLRGRKFSQILSCLLIITGWILTYFSNSIATLIIAECFHGLGNNSIAVVSLSSISEMVDPKLRLFSMSFYLIFETLGFTIVSILGRFLYWKTVSIIMSIPIVIAFVIACMWPESPAWLAYKGEYVKCEEVFHWLRGSDDMSQKEFKELVSAQKENFIANKNSKFTINKLWLQITSRDFYMPCFQSFVILVTIYANGSMVVVTYGLDMMKQATGNTLATRYGMIFIYTIIVLGTLTSTIFMKYFNNKPVYLTSAFTASGFMLGASVVTFLQSRGVLPNDSLLCLYFITAFMISISLGCSSVAFPMAAEIIPVKHRDLGGAVYVILLCSMHTLVLKVCPYLMLHIGMWGLFLMFSVIQWVCLVYVWKKVPETKGRTLQEIEDFYNHGHFVTRSTEDVEILGKK